MSFKRTFMLPAATCVRPRHPAGRPCRTAARKERAASGLPSGKPYGGEGGAHGVASYHLSVHANVSRGKGQSLVRTAAYNARTRLADERTGEVSGPGTSAAC